MLISVTPIATNPTTAAVLDLIREFRRATFRTLAAKSRGGGGGGAQAST